MNSIGTPIPHCVLTSGDTLFSHYVIGESIDALLDHINLEEFTGQCLNNGSGTLECPEGFCNGKTRAKPPNKVSHVDNPRLWLETSSCMDTCYEVSPVARKTGPCYTRWPFLRASLWFWMVTRGDFLPNDMIYTNLEGLYNDTRLDTIWIDKLRQ